MSQEKNLYFPIFYSTYDVTAPITDEEFGMLVRALLKHAPERTRPEGFSPHMLSLYNFMLESAVRVFDSRGKSPNFEKNTEPSPRHTAEKKGHIDYDAAYQRAIERSYGKK